MEAVLEILNAPGRIRTFDLRIRSPLLYPAELQAQYVDLLGIYRYLRKCENRGEFILSHYSLTFCEFPHFQGILPLVRKPDCNGFGVGLASLSDQPK
jgi:hypothetical protein